MDIPPNPTDTASSVLVPPVEQRQETKYRLDLPACAKQKQVMPRHVGIGGALRGTDLSTPHQETWVVFQQSARFSERSLGSHLATVRCREPTEVRANPHSSSGASRFQKIAESPSSIWRDKTEQGGRSRRDTVISLTAGEKLTSIPN